MMERRKVTWKDIAMILLGIVISAGGFMVKDLYAKVETKVDKTEFYAAVETMNKNLETMDKNFNGKSDLIIQLVKQHAEDSRE